MLCDRESLAFHFVPMDVSPFGPIDHQAITTTKKRAVEGQRDRFFRRRKNGLDGCVFVKIAAQRSC